jgi:putative endonuclease
MAKDDLLTGTIDLCRAILKKRKGPEDVPSLDLELQAAVDRIRTATIERDLSKADERALEGLTSLRDRLKKVAKKRRAKAAKPPKAPKAPKPRKAPKAPKPPKAAKPPKAPKPPKTTPAAPAGV